MYTGEILRQLRVLKGIRQISVAEQLGISQQAYSKLEKRKKIKKERFNEVVKLLPCTEEEVRFLRKTAIMDRLMNGE